jgi:hypothetical protein
MPQSTPPSCFDKFATKELRALAAGPSTRPVQVLVQPDLPLLRLAVSRVERGGVERVVPVGVREASPDDVRLADERIAATRAYLVTVLGSDPHWLGAARTFAVRATPAQLRAIVESPLIRTVWPDRSHRLPTGPAT